MSDEGSRGDRWRRRSRIWWEVWLPLLLAGLALAGLNLALYLRLAPGAP